MYMSRTEIILAQEEYIKFLTEMADRNAIYLHIHGMGYTEEDQKKGKELRAKIEQTK